MQHAERIPHDEQSKLVDFCIRLQQTMDPDPIEGWILELGEIESFWSVIPRFDMSSWFAELEEEEYGRDGNFKPRFLNMTAFIAQLSESEFHDTSKGTWKSFNLRSFMTAHCQRPRASIRYICMWLIYAPRTFWFSARSENEQGRRHPGPNNNYQPASNYWPEWKQRLLDYHRTPGIVVDRETHELVERALLNMNEIEAENPV
ncbi:unnamed protein product [Clonostachys rosea]|uniref:Uncharacterized protein n=1 Tax=Bionectria ochroleuca TaxID=29856 RepID=A0ABY6UPF3_BIOOC|nr:unnamed protein product [Clonostachys rosea]